MMQFKHTQLPNGLTIAAEVNPDAATTALGFFVRTGSRDETPDVLGVSHFLEHMVFKGTARRSTWDVNRQFDEMGADYNAGTTEENTIFYASVLPEFQDRVVDLLADILRPALRGDDFDTEKKVILDEIAVYDDQPRFRLYDKLMSEFFAGHPLGNEIPGTRESITALTRDQMQAYFDRRYVPGNITVVAAGRCDYDRLLRQVDDLCGRWPAGPAGRVTPPAPTTRTRKIIADPKVARQHVGLMSPAPSAQDEQRWAAQILATILGDSTGSRLFYALIEPALVDEAALAYSPMDLAGAFVTFLSCDADKAAAVVEIAQDEYRKFNAQGPTEAEMQAARNKIASSLTLRGELPIGRLSDVGFDWIYRRQYMPLAEQIDRLFAVSAQEVVACARQYDLTQHTLLALGPLEKIE